MNVLFEIRKINGKYYIIFSSQSDIDVYISKSTCCSVFDPVYNFTVESADNRAGELIPLEFDGDGIYKVFAETSREDGEVTIPYFEDFLDIVIESVYHVLCFDNCNNCNENVEKCDFLTAKTNLDAYVRLVNPIYKTYFEVAKKYGSCKVQSYASCTTGTYVTTGLMECETDLLKYFIALDLLAIYFYEQSINYTELCGDCNKDLQKERFRIDEIICCLEGLGDIYMEFEDEVKKLIGTFTITTGAYYNEQPSQIGDYDITIPNRSILTFTPDMFTTGTTPPYTDPENDAPYQIMILTLPSEGNLFFKYNHVVENQIIDIDDIDAGHLEYAGPQQNAATTVTFRFAVNDKGSKLFTI